MRGAAGEICISASVVPRDAESAVVAMCAERWRLPLALVAADGLGGESWFPTALAAASRHRGGRPAEKRVEDQGGGLREEAQEPRLVWRGPDGASTGEEEGRERGDEDAAAEDGRAEEAIEDGVGVRSLQQQVRQQEREADERAPPAGSATRAPRLVAPFG